MNRARSSEPAWARKLRRRISWARAALIWEQLWQAAWPAACVIGLFVALALLGLWSILPVWGRIALDLGLVLGLIGALADGSRRFRLPTEEQAARRLERDNGLKHRPLGTLADRPATPISDAAALGLWQAHQARAIRALRSLRPVWPHPGVIRRDPMGARQAVVLLLVIACVIGWRDAGPRLQGGLRVPHGVGNDLPVEIQAWITPPAYTGAPARFLAEPRLGGRSTASSPDEPIWIPDDSMLSARLGGDSTPKLAVQSREGSRSVAFAQPAPGSYSLSYKLTADGTVSVVQSGRRVAKWIIRVIPDRPPVIGLAADPGQTERAALAVPYLAEDDYGVESVNVELKPRGPVPQISKEKQLSLKIALPGTAARHVQETAYFELASHPWAGLPVSLRLTAKDARGQTASSKPIETVLPERIFRDPLAKAIIEQRKQLAYDFRSVPRVAATLNALTFRGERFFEDEILYLGLRAAYWRLHYAKRDAVPDGVYDLLWSLALRAEDGELAMAERALRNAEKRFRDALNSESGDSDFKALSKELRRALDRFVEALAKQAERNSREGEGSDSPPEQPQQNARLQDLHDLLDKAGKLGELGDREAARDLLSQLEAMIQNMQAGGPNARSAADRQRDKAARQLSELMDRQQALLDQTFRQNQGNPLDSDRSAGSGSSTQSRSDRSNQASRAAPEPGGSMPGNMDGGGSGQGRGPEGNTPIQRPDGQGRGAPSDQAGGTPGGPGGAAAQEALRRELGEIMGRLGESTGDIPGALGRAERSMRDAREALKQGEPGEALDPQREALDQLQRGAQALSRQMEENGATGMSGGGSIFGTDRDPLGRPMPTSGPDFGIGQHVPDGMQIERARRILDEIERRASERDRPPQELDYLERLLRRF